MSEIKRNEKIQEIFDIDEDKKENVDSKNHEVKEISKNRVKELRKNLDLTVKDFVDGIDGFSPETLSSIEKGNSGLTLDKALKIAQKYEVSLDYLFGISDYINENELALEKAFDYIFDIQFPLFDNESDPMLVINFSTNEYLLEYFYHKKLLVNKKENKEITIEEFNLELENLRNKYFELIKSPIVKNVKYNCTKID